MVTDSPTETMKSTVPAASPPNNMLAKSIAAFTNDPVGRRASRGRSPHSGNGLAHKNSRLAPIIFWRAGSDRLRLALVLDAIDLADNFLVELPVGAFHHFGEILVHHNISGFRINHDWSLRTVEFPAEQRLHGGVTVHLALGGLHGVNDRRHSVIGADRREVRRRVGAVILLPCRNEALVLRIIEIGVVMMHGD